MDLLQKLIPAIYINFYQPQKCQAKFQVYFLEKHIFLSVKMFETKVDCYYKINSFSY